MERGFSLSCKDGNFIRKWSMLDRLIKRLTPDYNNLKYCRILGILFVVSFFIRFPFFFRDYIDRDESTFILMAQSWVDGNLPYTELWDLKPPITYLFFAIILSIFGKSLLAIRFIGVLIVTITAFYSYKIAKVTTSKKVALWIGLVCVALLSMLGSLQGVMSEHVCMVFFMPALYLLIKKQNWYWVGIASLLMGLAVMTKLNVAYPVLALGLYHVFYHLKNKNYNKAITNTVAYGAGILCIIFLTFLPYYINGNGSIWWKSVVLASLEYTGARREPIASFLPITLLLVAFFFVTWKKKYLNYKEVIIQILTLTVISILFSFIRGGRINGHYLIQLHPIFIVLAGILISKIAYLQKVNYRPYLFFFLLLLPAEAYIEYVNIVKHKIEKGSFFNGEGVTVPKYITENNISTENILFLGYHIGYWQLNAKPPTKSATHPSNICRNELFPFYDNQRKTGVEEISYIMEEIQPQTVVIRQSRSIFDPKLVEENNYINTYLSNHYMLKATVDKAEIYTYLK
jgi:hypothetical protein